MRRSPLFLLLPALFAPIPVATAQPMHTPASVSPERAAIFNALRVPVRTYLTCPVRFAAGRFNVGGNWAFVEGNLLNPDGSPLTLAGTPLYEECVVNEACDGDGRNFVALLQRRSGRWRVVQWAIAPTDCGHCIWEEQYGLPRGLVMSR